MKRLLSILSPRVRYYASMATSVLVLGVALYAGFVTQNYVWFLVSLVELSLFVHMGVARDRRLRDSARIVFLNQCVESDEKLMEDSVKTMEEVESVLREMKKQNEILLDQLALASTREIMLFEETKAKAAKRAKKASRK